MGQATDTLEKTFYETNVKDVILHESVFQNVLTQFRRIPSSLEELIRFRELLETVDRRSNYVTRKGGRKLFRTYVVDNGRDYRCLDDLRINWIQMREF